MRLRAKVTKSTGYTRHSVAEVVDGRIVGYTSSPTPSWVEISPEDDGFYLFHLDEKEQCLADTLHFTLDEAKRQANLEYGITSDEWFESSEAKQLDKGPC